MCCITPFVDEPSAGLDPVSRRNLWNVILRTMSHRSVILTTHSMEEAEALCQRIGIMVRGGDFKCIGTPKQLKDKHGEGFEIELQFKPATEDQLQKLSHKLGLALSHF